ncbi:ArsR/SmtB family transcription factor [Paraconexibacter antarcticus]|uniref:ArsR/SmtB family transcription factor n=1 Tax=Paraconexibacter antarcticus TaxID=2949664 RepID=UPI003460947A
MRIKVLDHLHRHDEASVQEVATALGASHATVSRHLNLFHRAEILGRRRDGPRVRYRITDPAVLRLCDEVCQGLAERHPGLDIQLTQQAQEAAA